MTETTLSSLPKKLMLAREEKGWELSDVAGQLKLSEERLQTFETPELVIEQLDAFERGYLRNYLILLELDPHLMDVAVPKIEDIACDLHSSQHFNAYRVKPSLVSFKTLKSAIWLVVGIAVAVFIYQSIVGVADVSDLAQEGMKLIPLPEK